jgi:crotonobetainyl-CoA:carnitine CoA-transferase CaiB-like acyl-CoA transferase
MMRVLDLTEGVAGPFATLLLAEVGAEVIKVEALDPGEPQPDRADEGDPDAGIDRHFLERRKRSLAVNLKGRQGRDLFLRLVATADAVVESHRPGALARLGLSFRALRRANPKIVLTSISNFGQTGPRRHWEASELVLQAMGGIVESTGEAGGTPVKLGGYQASYIAGVNAATATLAAVQGVWAGKERGVHVDIAIQETFSPHWVRHIQAYIYNGREPARGAGPQVSLGFPGVARARDGDLYLLALRAEWESFAHFLGLEQFITHEWSDRAQREARWDEIDPHFHAAVARRDREDWMAAGVELGYTFAPVADAQDVLANRHFAARGFFAPAEVEGASVPCPGLPFSSEMRPVQPNRAPRRGEHTEEICRELLELGEEQLSALRAGRVIA